jgi:hypothetical protein
MRRCVAPAHLMMALLSVTSLVRGADRVAETRQGDGGWNGLLCDGAGDSRHVLDRLTPVAKGPMGTYGPTGVPSLVTAWREGGRCLGNEVPGVGTE